MDLQLAYLPAKPNNINPKGSCINQFLWCLFMRKAILREWLHKALLGVKSTFKV